MSSEGRRSPEQIENEIAATRAQISDTLDAIQYRLSPVRLLTDTFTAARGVAGDAARGAAHVGGDIRDVGSDFATNLGEAIRNNPVPVALLGVGLGWLLLAGRGSNHARTGRRRDYDSALPATWKPPYGYGNPDAAAPAASESGGDLTGSVTHMAADVREGAEHAYTVVEGQARQVKDTMAEIGAEVRARAAGLAEGAGTMAQGAQEGVARAQHRIGEAAGELRQHADRAAMAARDYTERARAGAGEAGRSLVRTAEEHPLLLAATLFAAGAALAALLPRTRTEEALMGGTAEEFRRTAKTTAQEMAREAKGSARAAARRVAAGAEEAARSMGGDGQERDGGEAAESRFAEGGTRPRTTNGGGEHSREDERRH